MGSLGGRPEAPNRSLCHSVFQGCTQGGLAVGRMHLEKGTESLFAFREVRWRDDRKEEQITEQQLQPELSGEVSSRRQEGEAFSCRLTCQKLLKRTGSQIQQMKCFIKKKCLGFLFLPTFYLYVMASDA